MSSENTIVKKIISINIIVTASCLIGCSSLGDKAEFNTNPDSYKTAKMTPSIIIPKNIANNIERQQLYPISGSIKSSDNNSNSIKSEVTAVPPTLIGKIKE